jgi:hypothetical protein
MDGKNDNLQQKINEALREAAEDVSITKGDTDAIRNFRAQNSRLRKLLKDLSDKLTALLERQKKAKSNYISASLKQSIQAPIEENTMAQQLETTYKQLAQAQRDLKFLQQKYDKNPNTDKYYGLLDQLTEKEKETEKQLSERNTIDKMLKEKSQTFDTIKSELGQDDRKKALNDEVRTLKDKFKELNKKDKDYELQAQKKNEYIMTLESKFRLICDKTGYNPESEQVVQRTKWDPKKLDAAKKKPKVLNTNWKVNPDEAGDEEDEPIELTEQKMNEMRKKIADFKKTEKTNDSTNKKEIVDLKEQYEKAKKMREDLEKKSLEKEKSSYVLACKVRELHRVARNQNVLPPLQDEDIKVKNQSIKGRIGDHLIKSTLLYKGYRKDERGSSKYGVDFNDREAIQDRKVRISQFNAWHDGTKVVGIQAQYRTPENDIIKGEAHVKDSKVQAYEFKVEQDDYLKEISGFLDKKEEVIECLILTSFKGQSQKMGESGKDSKLFKLDINELEFPAILFGTLREGEKSWLSRIGVFISSEEIEERMN